MLNTLRFAFCADITEAESLIENLSADYVLAGKRYDSDALILKLAELGSEAVISSRANRKSSV